MRIDWMFWARACLDPIGSERNPRLVVLNTMSFKEWERAGRQTKQLEVTIPKGKEKQRVWDFGGGMDEEKGGWGGGRRLLAWIHS